MDLGKQIHTFRTQKNMSQGDLADALNVSRQSVSKWETNATVPALDKLLDMAKLFEVSLDTLVDNTAITQQATADTSHPHEAMPPHRRPKRQMVGICLLVAASVLLLFLLSFGLLGAFLCAAPLFVAGILCLCAKRHLGLWLGWSLYALFYAYLRFSTGNRLWWVFLPETYRPEMGMNTVIVVCMALGFLILTGLTIRQIYKSRKAK